MKFLVEPGGSMTGSLRVPGDKSMSHRTVMFGALAELEDVTPDAPGPVVADAC